MIEYSDKDGFVTSYIEGSIIDIIGDVAKMLHVIHLRIANQDLMSGKVFEASFKEPEFIEAIFKPDENDRDILEALNAD